MSLMGFARDIGRRLFDRDEDAAEEIKNLIEANNPGVKDLAVTYDDQTVMIESGDCVHLEASKISAQGRSDKAVHRLRFGSVAGLPENEDTHQDRAGIG